MIKANLPRISSSTDMLHGYLGVGGERMMEQPERENKCVWNCRLYCFLAPAHPYSHETVSVDVDSRVL